MNHTTKSTRKCSNCGQWSEWNMNVEDRCKNCGALLDKAGYEQKQKHQEWQIEQQKKFQIGLIEIKPTDGPVTVFFKNIIRALQVSFIAVMSFILWLITLLAG
ncbi:MAG: hypothetical protein LPJ89_02450 [Hymenobacteraceae bacterium]|nr:hypothetical protein [Hymenobacteraceae bacterium]MDX5397582.1 hypothetical protein [Hymenobacteraceae bacterium]MDX5442626.1 hypothetical protein [Hymenobacteraceae bacterium]MDX5513662.1 hypothetical protein [Hymenobacteraceae bacterium]